MYKNNSSKNKLVKKNETTPVNRKIPSRDAFSFKQTETRIKFREEGKKKRKKELLRERVFRLVAGFCFQFFIQEGRGSRGLEPRRKEACRDRDLNLARIVLQFALLHDSR